MKGNFLNKNRKNHRNPHIFAYFCIFFHIVCIYFSEISHMFPHFCTFLSHFRTFSDIPHIFPHFCTFLHIFALFCTFFHIVYFLNSQKSAYFPTFSHIFAHFCTLAMHIFPHFLTFSHIFSHFCKLVMNQYKNLNVYLCICDQKPSIASQIPSELEPCILVHGTMFQCCWVVFNGEIV